MFHPTQRVLLAVIAMFCLLTAEPASAQQPANEIELIKKDVKELQDLVREIEGRLFVLQQRLSRLPKATPPSAIDQNAALLKRIFNELTMLRSGGKLKQVKINVTVMTAGVVLLKGQVADADQMKKVLETVRKVPGVKSIVNQITVGKPKDTNTTTTTMFFDGDAPFEFLSRLHVRAEK